MVRPTGLEPVTYCLEGSCYYPTELRARISFYIEIMYFFFRNYNYFYVILFTNPSYFIYILVTYFY